MLLQQAMADVMEIPDKRHALSHGEEPVADMRNGHRRVRTIDRDTNQFRSGLMKLGHLSGGRFDLCRIGIGHGLDRDRPASADRHGADFDFNRFPAPSYRRKRHAPPSEVVE